MLDTIAIENFRCINSATLSLDRRATGVFGANASGKTSLLEAIHFLAHGRSFRAALRAELVQTGARSTRVVATTRDRAGRTIVAGVECDGQTTELRLNAQPAAAWQVAHAIPTQIIDPSIHRLLEEGAVRRRRLMDWGVFHVKPAFIHEWRRYQRALSQRNAALKSGTPSSGLHVWSEALVSAAQAVHASRSAYIEEVTPAFHRISSQLLGEAAHMAYRRGWNNETELWDALAQSRPSELRQKTTVVGAHRADIEIRWNDALARKRVSRGQQKLLAAALVLAQIEVRARIESSPVCLMLDDPAAELDVDNLGKLLKVVADTPAQLILSSLQKIHFDGIDLGRAFHVERGKFHQVL